MVVLNGVRSGFASVDCAMVVVRYFQNVLKMQMTDSRIPTEDGKENVIVPSWPYQRLSFRYGRLCTKPDPAQAKKIIFKRSMSNNAKGGRCSPSSRHVVLLVTLESWVQCP